MTQSKSYKSMYSYRSHNDLIGLERARGAAVAIFPPSLPPPYALYLQLCMV